MQNNKTDFGRLTAIMRRVSEAGGMLLVHSEDDDMVHYNYDNAREDGLWDWWNMHCIHSNLSEGRVLQARDQAGNKDRVPNLLRPRERERGRRIGSARRECSDSPSTERPLHNYACFSADSYREENGMKYHTYPSLKSEDDRKTLWDGLLDGRLSTLATDLVSTTWEEKIRFKTVADVTGGHNGIETRMGIAYSVGVVELGMSLQRFVDITSTNAAKIFGLYPRKGVIAPGSDADICIIDPTFDRNLTLDDLHLEDYSIWEGWHVPRLAGYRAL